MRMYTKTLKVLQLDWFSIVNIVYISCLNWLTEREKREKSSREKQIFAVVDCGNKTRLNIKTRKRANERVSKQVRFFNENGMKWNGKYLFEFFRFEQAVCQVQ